jgi:hypothetical protein
MTTNVSKERWCRAHASELDQRERQPRRRCWPRPAWPIARGVLATFAPNRLLGDDPDHWRRTRFGGYSFTPAKIGDLVEFCFRPHTNASLLAAFRVAGFQIGWVHGPWDTLVNESRTVRSGEQLEGLPTERVRERPGAAGPRVALTSGAPTLARPLLNRPDPSCTRSLA